MNLIKNELDKLIAALSESQSEMNASKLHSFIIAYGTAQRVQASRDMRRVFNQMGLIAVDKFALNYLGAHMEDVSTFTGQDLENEREWLALGVKHLTENSYMRVREEESKEEGPEFTIDDPDLDRLMNDTAALLGGNANMDVGLTWADSLEKIESRLKIANDAVKYKQIYEQLTEALDLSWLSGDVVSRVYKLTSKLDELQAYPRAENVDPVSLYQTRYRVHMTMDNTLGRATLGKFRSTGVKLKDVLAYLPYGTSIFLSAMRQEFGIDFSVHAKSMYEMNSDELAAFVDSLPNKKGLGQ